MSTHPTRRNIILSGAAVSTSLAFADDVFAQGGLSPTPACGADSAPTLRQTEGPYFKPRSPERQSLIERGVVGRQLELTGFVLTRSCEPVAKALVDFWQADANGAYDNAGFRLRGHQFTDADGRYRLLTIIPARYPGRTPHIHVKVQAPNGPVLTTQLYFPDEPSNESDRLFRRALLIRMAEAKGAAAGQFDFVLDMA